MEVLNDCDDIVIDFDKLTPNTDFLLSEFDRIPGWFLIKWAKGPKFCNEAIQNPFW